MNQADCSQRKEQGSHTRVVYHPVNHHLLWADQMQGPFPEASMALTKAQQALCTWHSRCGNVLGLGDAWRPRVGCRFRGQDRTDVPVKPARPLLLSRDCDTVSHPS